MSFNELKILTLLYILFEVITYITFNYKRHYSADNYWTCSTQHCHSSTGAIREWTKLNLANKCSYDLAVLGSP